MSKGIHQTAYWPDDSVAASWRDKMQAAWPHLKTVLLRRTLDELCWDGATALSAWTPEDGVDAWLLGDRLRLSADVLGAYTATPRVKLAGALAVFPWLYVMAGVDDAFNRPGYLSIINGNAGVPRVLEQVRYGRDYFLGASLHFTDEDLATLLRIYGVALAGFLAG